MLLSEEVKNSDFYEDFQKIKLFMFDIANKIESTSVSREIKDLLKKAFTKMFKEIRVDDNLSIFILQNNIVYPAKLGVLLMDIASPNITTENVLLDKIKTGEFFLKDYILYQKMGGKAIKVDMNYLSTFGVSYNSLGLKKSRQELMRYAKEIFQQANKEEFDFNLFNAMTEFEEKSNEYTEQALRCSFTQDFDHFDFKTQLTIREENSLFARDGFYRATKQDKKIIDLQKKGVVPSIFNKKSLKKLKGKQEFLILLDTSGSTETFSLYKGLDVMAASAIKYIKDQFNNNVDIKIAFYSDDIIVKESINGFMLPTGGTPTANALSYGLKEFKDIVTIEDIYQLFKINDSDKCTLEKRVLDVIKYSDMVDKFINRTIPKMKEIEDLSLMELKEIFDDFVITNGFVKTDKIDYILSLFQPFGKFPFQNKTLKDIVKYNFTSIFAKLEDRFASEANIPKIDDVKKIFDAIIEQNKMEFMQYKNRHIIHLTDGQANELVPAYFFAYALSFTNCSFGQLVVCPNLYEMDGNLEDMVMCLGTDSKANISDIKQFEKNFKEIADFASGKNKTIFLTKELHNNILSMFDLNIGIQYFMDNEELVNKELRELEEA